MGAGTDKDHFIQDAAEAYIVYRLQKLAVDNNVSVNDDVSEKQKHFVNYCVERSIVEDFDDSVYKHNIDKVVDSFFSDIVKKYPGKKFDFVDVEKEFRDEKRKGDFIIQFADNSFVSISLKNYKNGFDRIQLCSGTWPSFVNNFIFDADGVGMIIDPFTNETFRGSNREKRDDLLEKLGYTSLSPIYKFFDYVQDTIKEDYARSDFARYWKNISSKWKNDCKDYGLKATGVVIDALNNLPKDTIKNRIINMAGLTYNEDILLIGKGKYICSLTNDKYATILKRVNSDSCFVKYVAVKKSVVFTLCDDQGVIVKIDVPFTLQKNGAWYIPSKPYNGEFFHEKEGVNLVYGERRPKKSKEIATSINTYLDLKKAGIY